MVPNGCGAAVPWADVSHALHSSVAFEVLALLQAMTIIIISGIFWAVFLLSPYPLQVAFGGNAVGRVVTATASVRNRTVVSISDYCAASGSTPQRILMTLCTIFSMLSISAAVFCEDRLKMWTTILGPEHAPYLEEKAHILWMYVAGQLGMFFTGNMEVRDGPRYFQTFFMLMHTVGAIGFVTLAPISAWWFNNSNNDLFLWLLIGSTGCFSVFSVLSLFTDVYDFPLRPRWMTVIVTEPQLLPGAHDIEIRIAGMKKMEGHGESELVAEDIVIVASGPAAAHSSPAKRVIKSITNDPVFHQMWLNHTLSSGPFPDDPLLVRMTLRRTAPPPGRGVWSTVFVSLEFTAMLLAAISCIALTYSFARLNFLQNLPLSPVC